MPHNANPGVSFVNTAQSDRRAGRSPSVVGSLSNTLDDGGSKPRSRHPLWGKSSQTLPITRSSTLHAAAVPRSDNVYTRPHLLEIPAGKAGHDTCIQEEACRRSNRGPQTDSSQWKQSNSAVQPTTRPRANSGEITVFPPRFVRTATSIPDYRTINAAYRKSSAPLPSREKGTINPRTDVPVTRPPLVNWNDAGPSSVRGSFRSAVTNSSSAAGTERSSIRTDRSSSSDMDHHPPNWPLVQEDDMTVEDTIALYAEGFADDPVVDMMSPTLSKPFTSSPLATRSDSDTVRTRNSSISFAPPTALLRPPTQVKASVSAHSEICLSTLTVPTHDDTASPLQDRLKALIGPPRDRYGFKRASQHVTLAQYDAWNASYTKYLERRRKKWFDLMKQHRLPTDDPTRFPPKSDKVKRYVRKGIPPEWRGAAWFFYTGGPDHLAKHPGLYSGLVIKATQGGLSDSDRDHIERDLFRTFPDHIKFKADESPYSKDAVTPQTKCHSAGVETPMILSLRRVLQAFAVHQPKIGYCQSLNFLAGYLLIFLHGNEEKAFHLLWILTSQHLPGTHGVSLEGANIDIGVFMVCLRDAMPALWTDKIDDRADTTVQLAAGDMRVSTGLPTVSLATTGWFMGCFAATLPVETTCRVWDCLFYEGSKTLFRVGLAIFKLSEREIRITGEEPMEVFQVVQTSPKSMVDANLVIGTATKKSSGWSLGGVAGFGGLSQKVIEKRREEKRGMYRTERERVLLKALTMPVENTVFEEKGGNGDRKGRKKMSSLRGKQ